MFAATFILVAARYAALPHELTLMRLPAAGAELVAPKSLFTAFRVPLMNLTHGLMAAVMLSCQPSFTDARRRRAYAGVFWTLLFTVTLKSGLEALGLSVLPWTLGRAGAWLTGATLATVVVGVGVAFLFAQGVRLPWPELDLGRWRAIVLIVLFAMYLGMVAVSFLISHRPSLFRA
jgi:hypothetical protein